MTSNRTARSWSLSWIVVLLTACVRESATPPATFAGSYSLAASGLSLEETARGHYRGTWRTDGAEYPVTAEIWGEDGALLRGWVEMPSGRASLAASLAGNTLYLGVELLSHRLERIDDVDPAPEPAVEIVARPPPPARLRTVEASELLETVSRAALEPHGTAAESTEPRLIAGRRVDGADVSAFRRELFERAANAENGLPFDAAGRHPAGFFFSYPAVWKLQALAEGTLSLTPPGVRMGGGGPAEMYLILGESTRLRRPDEPAARQLAARFVAAELPFVEPDGEPLPLAFGSREAAVYAWSARDGDEISQRVWLWLSIGGGALQGLLAIIPADLVAARRTIAEDVFATFDMTPPRGDRRLVGRWRREVLYNPGGFSMLIERCLVLDANGRAFAGDRELDPANDAATARRGTWRADGESFRIEWSDGGSESWFYSLAGDDLLCRGSSQPRLWRRAAPDRHSP